MKTVYFISFCLFSVLLLFKMSFKNLIAGTQYMVYLWKLENIKRKKTHNAVYLFISACLYIFSNFILKWYQNFRKVVKTVQLYLDTLHVDSPNFNIFSFALPLKHLLYHSPYMMLFNAYIHNVYMFIFIVRYIF